MRIKTGQKIIAKRKCQLPRKFSLYGLRLSVFALIFTFPVFAQKIAVLTPDKTVPSRNFAAAIEKKLSAEYKVLDASLSETAFRSIVFENENPFNLSAEEAKNTGRAIGCHYFLLVKHETLRRASLERDDFYESYAVVYAAGSRTGKLIFWKLKSFESEKPSEAERKLYDSIPNLAGEISDALKKDKIGESASGDNSPIEELPPENSPEAGNFRPPLPYRRISPVYTQTAKLYGIKATIDITVDIGETGKILRTEIARWAGYGLEESVTEAVRKMNWRPAERNGKPLPMRILLRYNFKNVENDD